MAPKLQRIMLITGASTGIGRYLAEYFANKGCTVYAGARKSSDVQDLSKIENVHGVLLDVTNVDHIGNAVDEIKSKYSALDVLINNAGVIGWGAVVDREIDYFRKIFEVNLFGAINMVKGCYPLLKNSNNSPIIINMSSQGANYTMPYWTPYSMTKYALESFSEGLRRELRPQGIKVAVIQPGAITSQAFNSQKCGIDDYSRRFHSEFTRPAVEFFSLAFNRSPKKEKSPLVVAKDVYNAITHKNYKYRYHPGRRLVPDIMVSKLPRKWVDMALSKMIKK